MPKDKAQDLIKAHMVNWKRQNEEEFIRFMKKLNECFGDPPKTELIIKDGILKRTSGIFQSWAECYAIVSKDK